MLCLTRKRGESIRINDDVTIIVSDIRGDQVRLAIEAPPEVTVHREEVWRQIQRESGK